MLYNIHEHYREGELGFIVDNGEHLDDIDINKLIGYPIFIMNKSLIQEKIPASYYVLSDGFFHKKHFKTELNVGIVLNPEYITKWKVGFKLKEEEPFFQTNWKKSIWKSNSSLFTAIQLAYFMGINPAVIVGLDYDKKLIGSPLEKALALASDAFQEDDRGLFNGSSFTRLSYKVIPKISLDVFKE
jgi:hypothetical protein